MLLLIIYNNAYTKYKITELNNKYIYLFLASIICVQLIEFFIWKNINDKYYNNIFSILLVLLIIIQPIASIMIISDIKLRNQLLLVYLVLVIPYSINMFSNNYIHSSVSNYGHLKWNIITITSIVRCIWIFFFLFPFIYEKQYLGFFIFGIITLIICFINYKNDNTISSMWCWSVNSIFIYYAFYLLLYLPFLEKQSIC
jgi:hypothetical protein